MLYPKSSSTPAACTLAIACRGVVKRFHLYEQCTRSLRELVIHTLRGKPLNVSRPYFAVSGLDLEVHQGESLAIIGANGSGKSTVLRLIAGIYPPSAGELTTNGRVAAVLELGASFHPELTGMENISLYGTVLGLSNREIAARVPEILAFADIGDFVHMPVKYYSSGMQARLAFAVAVCVDPDILLLDEVMAVGDKDFQQRGLDRLRAFHDRGGTLIIVSHDLGTVRTLCRKALWMDHGRPRMLGKAGEVIEAYLGSVQRLTSV